MSVVAVAMRELMAIGVHGDALVSAVERIEAELSAERRSTLDQAIEAVTRRLDSVLPDYDPLEHRRALGRARQAKLADRKRQRASESSELRQEASGSVSTDAPPSLVPASPGPPSTPIPSSSPPPPKGSPAQASAEPLKPARHAKPTAQHVEAIWVLQPVINGKRRSSRPDVETALIAALRRGGDFAEIEAHCRVYFALPECLRDGGQFAMGAARLLERDRWREFGTEASSDARPRSAAWGPDEWRAAMQLFTETGRWKDTLGPLPGEPDCRVPAAILAEFREGARAA